VIGSIATLSPLAATEAALAAPNPGQAINNDYGQTTAQVNAEVTAQVNAARSVVAARAAVKTRHATLLVRIRAEAAAHSRYLAAIRSNVPARIVATRKAFVAAHARTVAARAAETRARATLARILRSATTSVRARHFRPVNGTWDGAVATYFAPDTGVESLQVRIVVAGGHVTAVTVPVFYNQGESGDINRAAVPTLCTSALAAKDTAKVANVSGASLTSAAFRTSLQSALTHAGYKG
jgi:uncharacterized protein with FMN-binding domain